MTQFEQFFFSLFLSVSKQLYIVDGLETSSSSAIERVYFEVDVAANGVFYPCVIPDGESSSCRKKCPRCCCLLQSHHLWRRDWKTAPSSGSRLGFVFVLMFKLLETLVLSWFERTHSHTYTHLHTRTHIHIRLLTHTYCHIRLRDHYGRTCDLFMWK